MHAVQTKLSLRDKAYTFIWQILDFIYPPYCIGCKKIGYRCCPSCLKSLDETRNIYSDSNISLNYRNSFLFQEKIPHIDRVYSISPYEGIIKKIIIGLKYQRRIGVAEFLIDYLVQMYEVSGIDVDIILPVPISRKRLHKRSILYMSRYK